MGHDPFVSTVWPRLVREKKMPSVGWRLGFRGWDLELEVSTEPHACVQGGGYPPRHPKGSGQSGLL